MLLIILINPLLHILHVTQQMHSSPRLLAALPAHAATSTRLKKPALSLDQRRTSTYSSFKDSEFWAFGERL